MNVSEKMWHTMKCPNIHTVEVPEGKEIKKGEIFKEIILKNFPNLLKNINLYIEDVQQMPRRINTK